MTNNSISTLLSQLQTSVNNSINSFATINSAVTSNNSNIVLTIENEDGTKSSYNVPSFGYLKSSIDRINNTLDTLTNLDSGSGSTIRLSDGTYRRLLLSKVPSEAPTITSNGIQNTSINFGFKSNYFFENLVNPLLYVTYDLKNAGVNSNTQKVIVRKVIYQIPSDENTEGANYINTFQSGVSYTELISNFDKNKITYEFDEEINDVNIRSANYSGSFQVNRIINTSSNTTTDNGVKLKVPNKTYFLDKITYTDNTVGIKDGRVLTVGDILDVNTTPVTTRYKVVNVDSSNNSVELQIIDGYKAITIGENSLKISSSQQDNVSVDISVGINQYMVIFVKPVDPDSNIAANDFSGGIRLITNDLTYKDENGNNINLLSFYKNSVTDFGRVIESYAYDEFIPSLDAISPDAPSITTDNFKVVRINKHLSSRDTETITQLSTNKKTIESELDNIARDIEYIKTDLHNKSLTDKERTAKQSELDNLLVQQTNYSSEYSSITTQIESLASNSELESISSKYRIRGFWNIPTAKVSSGTGKTQNIIQFKIRYRYLSTSGIPNNPEEFKVPINSTTSATAYYSNWVEMLTPLRKRVKNESTNKWYWENPKMIDPDSLCFNSLDIPISKNEIVELQIKSISEAGYPSNPKEGEWCAAVMIPFSDTDDINEIVKLIEENKTDTAKAAINSTLTSLGIKTHVNSSFTSGDTYYAHDATNIASGFVSTEQKPISLYNKLTELSNALTDIKSLTEEIDPLNLRCYITDSGDNIIKPTNISSGNYLKEGVINYINVGNYSEAFKQLNGKLPHEADGISNVIITKTLYLNITCKEDSLVRLLSKFGGRRETLLNDSKLYDGKIEDYFYNNSVGVPIVTSSGAPSYDNFQRLNQYFYLRYKDLSGNNIYFGDDNKESGEFSYLKVSKIPQYTQLNSGDNDLKLFVPTKDEWKKSDFDIYQYNGTNDKLGCTCLVNPTMFNQIQFDNDKIHSYLTVDPSITIKIPITYKFCMKSGTGTDLHYITKDPKGYLEPACLSTLYGSFLGFDIFAGNLNEYMQQFDIIFYASYN